jgi:ferredoxin/sporulation protein YlmC with PRC-barrel domain
MLEVRAEQPYGRFLYQALGDAEKAMMANGWPVPIVERERCTGCGRCVTDCPEGALALEQGEAFVADAQACTYCGICERICPTGAIQRPFLIVFAADEATQSCVEQNGPLTAQHGIAQSSSSREDRIMATQKELTLGMTVRCLDGDAGRLERVVGDPETREPAYLVVRLSGARRRDVVVPVDLVMAVTLEQVLLDTTREALKHFPDYEITETKRPQPIQRDPTLHEPEFPFPWKAVAKEGAIEIKQRTVPEHTVELKQGMTVFDRDGLDLGRLQGVIMDATTHKAGHLVLHRRFPVGMETEEDRLIPVELIDFTIRSHIYLRIPEEQLRGLPVHREE